MLLLRQSCDVDQGIYSHVSPSQDQWQRVGFALTQKGAQKLGLALFEIRSASNCESGEGDVQ
jgi:hypothetical protein